MRKSLPSTGATLVVQNHLSMPTGIAVRFAWMPPETGSAPILIDVVANPAEWWEEIPQLGCLASLVSMTAAKDSLCVMFAVLVRAEQTYVADEFGNYLNTVWRDRHWMGVVRGVLLPVGPPAQVNSPAQIGQAVQAEAQTKAKAKAKAKAEATIQLQ